MKKANKYTYLKIIQQYYAAGYGWEEVSTYECNSTGAVNDPELFKHDLKEYRLMNYPTRTIIRKELNTLPVL